MPSLEFLKNDAVLDLDRSGLVSLEKQLLNLDDTDRVLARISLEMEIALEYPEPAFEEPRPTKEDIFIGLSEKA